MESTVVLKATRRESTGTRVSRQEREAGLLPAIVYGHNEESIPVTLNSHDLYLAMQHGHRLLDVELDGQQLSLLIKELQFDYLGDTVIHVDLTRVSKDERVKVSVELILRGMPVGVNEGGYLEQLATEIEVECAASAIPEEGLRVNVSEMQLNETLTAGDVKLPEGMTLVTEPGILVASCKMMAEELESEEAGEGAEPEVISREREEEESKD